MAQEEVAASSREGVEECDGDILRLSKEIDEILERKSAKHNLSALNVKSILTHLIKNDQVLTMLRNSIRGTNNADECENQSVQDFGLKLTRNKTKALAQSGMSLPHVLQSPKEGAATNNTKSTSTASFLNSFLDIEEQDEDEEDADYKPEDETSQSCSDGEESDDNKVGPKKPAKSTFSKNDSFSCQKSPNQASDQLQTNYSLKEIPYETRSKKSYDNVALDELEAALYSIRPDFEVNIFEAQNRDKDYLDFLTLATAGPSCSMQSENEDDDTINDPEYNFCEDNEILDEDEMQLNKATKITKKELSELFDDYLFGLFNENQGDDIFKDFEENACKFVDDAHLKVEPVRRNLNIAPAQFEMDRRKFTEPVTIFVDDRSTNATTSVDAPLEPIFLIYGDESTDGSAPLIVDKNSMPFLSELEQEHLKEQLRKHVQLLTQTFLLAKCVEGCEATENMVSNCLIDLKRCRDQRPTPGTSFFNVWNLEEAELLLNHSKTVNFSVDDWHAENKVRAEKRAFVANLIRNSTCFVYPGLLFTEFRIPPLGSLRQNVRTKYSEDVYLALCYLQFCTVTDDVVELVELLQKYCLPAFQVSTLRSRLINSQKKRSFGVLHEAVRNNKYPQFIRTLHPFDPSHVIAPCDWSSLDRPIWLNNFLNKASHLLVNCRSVAKAPSVDVLVPGIVFDKNGTALLMACPKAHLKYALDPQATLSAVNKSADEGVPSHPQKVNPGRIGSPRKKRKFILERQNRPISPEIVHVNIDSPPPTKNFPKNRDETAKNIEFHSLNNQSPIGRENWGNFTEIKRNNVQNKGNQLEFLLEAVSPDEFQVSPLKNRQNLKKISKFSSSPTKKAIKFLNQFNKRKQTNGIGGEMTRNPPESYEPEEICIKSVPGENMALNFVKFLPIETQIRSIDHQDIGKSVDDKTNSELDSPNSQKKMPMTGCRNKEKSGRYRKWRTIKNNQLKNIIHSCSTIHANLVDEALASYFCYLMKTRLFMHQSQLKSFLNRADEGARTAENSDKNFENLLAILGELPSSSSNDYLADLLCVFMSIRDALILNRLNLWKNHRLAANLLFKIKVIFHEMKRKSFLRATFSHIKKNSALFLSNLPKFHEFLQENFDSLEFGPLWDEIKPIFPHEACEIDEENFESIDFKSLTWLNFSNSLQFENASFTPMECHNEKFGEFSDVGQQQTMKFACQCCCHLEKLNLCSSPCNSCDFKILGNKMYLCKSKKIVPAEASYPCSLSIFQEVWSEERDRCLLEELRKNGANFENACQSAASILSLDVLQIRDRMQLLLRLLDEIG